jgi:UDP-N-acetylmuramoylalanine-D-glutamate ligase
MTESAYKKVLVIGLGETGLSLVRISKGYKEE